MTPTTDIKFKYILSREEKYLAFRPGDFVRVRNWGGVYGSYISAFKHFNGSTETPFYCRYSNYRNNQHTRLFKLMKVAEHTNYSGRVICYIIDNEKRGAVIDCDSLIPFKTFPLRPGELNEIKLEKIKQI